MSNCLFEFIRVEGGVKSIKLLRGGGAQPIKVWEPVDWTTKLDEKRLTPGRSLYFLITTSKPSVGLAQSLSTGPYGPFLWSKAIGS
jgi:hypothetical protein